MIHASTKFDLQLSPPLGFYRLADVQTGIIVRKGLDPKHLILAPLVFIGKVSYEAGIFFPCNDFIS